MFWAVVLPFQISCVILLASVLLLTAFLPFKKFGRFISFCIYSGLAVIAFVPVILIVGFAVDSVRFGDFKYASYADIPDDRSRRYMPPNATDIDIHKFVSGYFARYKISEDDFQLYLDELWQTYGDASPIPCKQLGGEPWVVEGESIGLPLEDLGWKAPAHLVEYDGPREDDGGGATYYVDIESGVVYQRTGYW